MMRFQYHAYLLADFRFVGTGRTPVLHAFVVRSESHEQITTNWKRGFYASVLHAQSAESYSRAVENLERVTKSLLPDVATLVKW